MKLRLLFALPLFALLGMLPAVAQPPRTTSVEITNDAGKKVSVKLVPRDKLRVKTDKRFSARTPSAEAAIPAPPAEFDLTKDKAGKMFSLPMHGNDQYGDCFPVACFHLTEFQLGLKGSPTVFSDRDVVNDYLRMSPDDQGTSDSDIIPWWKAGIPSSTKANKLIDYALVDPSDDASYYAAMYYLGGVVTTHELRTPWESVNGSGFIWDNTGRLDPNAGHAVAQAGRKLVNGQPASVTLTWGMYGYLTKAGRMNSDCEVVAVVCSSWFDSRGYTPNGDHYDDIATYWKAAVGKTLPTGLYPPKGPTPTPPGPPPVPPTPGKGFTGIETNTYANGVLVTKVVTASTLPAVEPGKPYTIDLSAYGPFVRWRVKHKLLAVIEHDSVVVTDDGDSITISPKAPTLADGNKGAPDWNAFLDFITKLLPIILQILAMFGA